jgi:hypothetical protein
MTDAETWHIEIGSSHIAIPFWYLVLENKVISKRIPNEATDLTMVLVRIVLSMSKDYVGINAALQRFKPDLDLIALLREEAVSKVHDFDCATRSCRQKIGRGRPCFNGAFIGTTEHTPMNLKANTLVQPAEKRAPRANFDVIRVRSQA